MIICGAELFTSNAAMLPAALYERRVSLQQLLRNWGIAYTGQWGSISLALSIRDWVRRDV